MTTILVVEDDCDTRSTLVELLSDHGYAVLEAADGEQALRQMAEAVPDIALVDLLLPRMDGWTLIDAMRSAPLLRAIPIVATTALSRPPPLPPGVTLLAKPFGLDDLLRALRPRRSARALPFQRREPGHVSRRDQNASSRPP
jgi:CheY-like chemotaxis protein